MRPLKLRLNGRKCFQTSASEIGAFQAFNKRKHSNKAFVRYRIEHGVLHLRCTKITNPGYFAPVSYMYRRIETQVH